MRTIKSSDLKLGKLIKREKMSNRIIYRYEHGEILQSYASIVGLKYEGKLYLGEDCDYSATTKQHMHKWLGCSIGVWREVGERAHLQLWNSIK